ncbi:manganese efflux pump MntP [Salana multivorans]
MSIPALLGIAVGVSADAFAAALTSGVRMRRLNLRHAAIIAAVFAGFQAVMPLLGWLLTAQFSRFLEPVDHWIAFGLLSLIGVKMIWDAIHAGESDKVDGNHLDVRRLLLLGVATSIDAAAIGVSLALLEVSILQAILIIGVVTLVLSLAAVVIGHRIGVAFRRPAELFGGLILILIGARILLEHLGIF